MLRVSKSLTAVFGFSLVFFSLVVIFKLKIPESGQGLFGGYLSALDVFVKNNPVTDLLFIVVLGLLVFKKPGNLILVPVAVLAAPVLAIFIAYLNLCLLALKPDRNLIADSRVITDKLISLEKTPTIEVMEMSRIPGLIIGGRMAAEGTETFFRQFLVNLIPENIIPVNIPESSIYIWDNKLIFTAPKASDLKAVSSRLGYLFLKSYLKPRLIKSGALVGILNRQDYLKLREGQIGNQLKEIDAYSTKIDKLYSAADKTVKDDKKGIAAAQAGLDSSQKSYQLELDVCKTAGYNDIFVHRFIRYHDDTYCLNKAQLDWGDKIDGYKQTLANLTALLVSDQKNLDSVSNIKTVTGNYRSVIAAQMNAAPDELGLFYDQSKIDIVLDYANARSVPAYLQTLVHEYLHYASFVSDQRVLPKAFEEGLTEYLAREIIRKDLGQELILGYPLLVKIIRQMATKIPADQLVNIYFTKDEALLSKLLDLNFGQNFYEDNSLQFEVLPYLPTDKAVETANILMAKIGGSILTENDLYSELNPKD